MGEFFVVSVTTDSDGRRIFVNYKKVPKSVGFNTKNERDRKLLKHVARRNFSGYVKNLIEADMKAKGKWEEVEKAPASKKEQKKDAEVNKFDALKEKLKRPSKPPGPFINQPKD